MTNREQGICGAPWPRGPVACPKECPNREKCDESVDSLSLPDTKTFVEDYRSKDFKTRTRAKIRFVRHRMQVVDSVAREAGISSTPQAEEATRRRCIKPS
jgi:hypothetical protein